MSLERLPNEILLLVASSTESEADFVSLAQVNGHLYETLIPHLYRRNARYSNGSALLLAVTKGNLPAFKKALQAWTQMKNSAELPTHGHGKYTPLFLAAHRGHLAIVKQLLAHRVDPNTRDRWNRTPLYGASIRGHVAVVEALLEDEQIKIDACNVDGCTPVSAAARNGNFEIVKILLARGANAGYVGREEFETIFHCAIRHRRPDILRLLVNRDDVDPNVPFSDYSPLQLAVEANNEDLVEVLLTDARVNPDWTTLRDAQTPLLEALLKNNKKIVQLLLDIGANRDLKDSTSLSPAMLLEAPSAEAREKLINERSFSFSPQALSQLQIPSN